MTLMRAAWSSARRTHFGSRKGCRSAEENSSRVKVEMLRGFLWAEAGQSNEGKNETEL